MTEKEILKAAEEWVAAERTGNMLAGITADCPDADIMDAYAVQYRTLEIGRQSGEALAGRKIAFTADTLRRAFRLREPAFGYMLQKQLFASGFTLRKERFARAMLEPEIAFRFKADLKGSQITVEDVLSATEGVCPAFEIVNGRVKNEGFRLADMVADDASFGGAVIGGNWTPTQALDLAHERAVIYKGREEVAAGAGAGVMGSPLYAIVWIANKLQTFGDFLHEGEIVLSGSLTRQLPAEAGNTYTACFSTLGEVNVEVR